jgi:glycosyltransferase involved in cell wall biosynthesis
MRILIANDVLIGAGGVETYLSTLVPQLQAHGHQVGVLHDDRATAPGPQRIVRDDVWRAGIQDEGAEAAFARVREFAPDVCFSHNMRALEVDERLTRAWPVVKMMHGHFGTCVSGHKAFAFPAVVPCGRTFGPACLLHYLPRRCGRGTPLAMMRDYVWGKRQRDLFARYQTIVVASRFMRDQFLRAGVPPGHVRAIPLFAPAVGSAVAVSRPRPIDVLFLGRLTNLKGPDAAIDAAARAGRQLGRRLNVMMAGDGPDRAYLGDLAVTSRVNTTFPGWVGPAERDRLLRESAVLVIPSRWPEPFGLVGLEAAAFGTPSVAFDTGGIRDWLTNDENGRLIDPASDTDGMGDAVAEILRDPALHCRLATGAREAATRFRLDVHVGAVIRVLEAAIGSPVAAVE